MVAMSDGSYYFLKTQRMMPFHVYMSLLAIPARSV